MVSAAALLLGSAAVGRPQGGERAAAESLAAPPANRTAVDDAPVRIDAVVTDKRGRAVPGLRASDFQLIENGTAQTLADVEFRTVPDGSAPLPAIETEADEIRAARQPGTRVFAFFVDEFHVAAGENTDRARDAVYRFIDEQLQPQDLAIVMRPLDPLTGLRFTRDRAALHTALTAFSGRKGDLTPRSAFEEQYIGRAPAAIAGARTQIVTAALRELTLRLGELQADRGVVVLVSEGLRDPAAPRIGRTQDVQGVAHASSRFHLSFYTFNPGQRAPEQAAGTPREPAIGTLEWLAAQTGGRAVPAGGDLASGMALMSQDLKAYYAITYRPAPADGKFHPVEIRTTRRNADVRARPGYWAPIGGEWRALLAAGSVAPISTRALHRSSLVETWIGIASDPSGQARMVLSWEPSGTSAASPNAILVRARTTGGTELYNGRVAAVQGGAAGQADSARFDVPAGRVELDLSVVDVQGKVLDTELRDFDVPDLRSQRRGPMLLFPEVVRTRTLKDFRAASADPDAAPSSLRVFARGDRLLIRVPVYDASGAAVTVSARVLNERGDTMRDIERTDSAAGDQIAQFALPLSWLVPGQYMIELSGANANGTVRERVAFRVRG
jgi:VWFA-related protein